MRNSGLGGLVLLADSALYAVVVTPHAMGAPAPVGAVSRQHDACVQSMAHPREFGGGALWAQGSTILPINTYSCADMAHAVAIKLAKQAHVGWLTKQSAALAIQCMQQTGGYYVIWGHEIRDDAGPSLSVSVLSKAEASISISCLLEEVNYVTNLNVSAEVGE